MYEEVMGRGNVDAIKDLMSENFVEHEELPGGIPPTLEGVKTFVNTLRTGFPDLQVGVNDIISQGDKVVGRATFKGTHKGEFMNLPATGKAIEFQVIDIVRFAGGKAVEHWGQMDNARLLTQLGVIPEQP